MNNDWKKWAGVVSWIEGAQEAVEQAVLRCPTGPIRNQLTEANICLMDAINKAKEQASK